jgi:hypothetical protein
MVASWTAAMDGLGLARCNFLASEMIPAPPSFNYRQPTN